jgi:hypothetical protein
MVAIEELALILGRQIIASIKIEPDRGWRRALALSSPVDVGLQVVLNPYPRRAVQEALRMTTTVSALEN